ncbi:tetratricopeptide repeat protein [Kordia sp.]|uniref:tetratricopeptide repeat protein n=1 Tax=Kordia sp. TaxID=1965332 RepID=UPI003B5CC92C
MFEKKINKVEKVEGENIFIFQYIDSAGNESKERKSFEAFLQPFVQDKNELIVKLQKSIADKEKIEGFLDEKVIQLSDKIQQLLQEKQQLEDQVQHFLTEIEGKDLSQTTNLYQEALELFIQGNISEALSILDEAKLEEIEQKALESVKNAAETRILKARILRVDHKYEQAGVNYEKAVKLYDDWGNNLEVANFFYILNDFQKASIYYKKSIDASETEEQRGKSLVNYGNLKRNNNEQSEALKYYEESLAISRKLAKNDSEKYKTHIITVLNNIAVICNNNNQLDKAETIFDEIIDLHAKLTAKQRFENFPNFGITLNNLSKLYTKRQQFYKAEEISTQALNAYKMLASDQPEQYIFKVCMVLNNLANIKDVIGKNDEAQALLNQSLAIAEEQAKYNPRTFMPVMADILNNLAVAERKSNSLHDAEEKYLKALTIYKELRKNNNNKYTRNIVGLQANLGSLQGNLNKLEAAKKTFNEAIVTAEELVKSNKEKYISQLAMVKINFAHFHQNCTRNSEEAIRLADEAVTHIFPLREIPYIQNYLSKALYILDNYFVDIDEYVAKKIIESR